MKKLVWYLTILKKNKMKSNYQKYSALFLVLILGSIPLVAQETVSSGLSPIVVLDWIFRNIIIILAALTAFGAFWAILYLNSKLLQVQKIKLLKEHGMEVMEEVKLIDKESWWQKIYDKSWNRASMDEEKDILLDHDYDGIHELDNVLPPWWVALFYGGIIVGVVYFGYYHVFDYGQSSSEEYTTEMEYAQAQVENFLSKQADRVDENNVAIVTDENKLSIGETIYMTNCAVCHGQNGEGGIGPNFADKYWIHGGHINDLYKTIKNGVPAKGMISWKSQLRPTDIQNVSSYILTLVGTNPENQKEAQGELYEAVN